jgi:hypothetical protein
MRRRRDLSLPADDWGSNFYASDHEVSLLIARASRCAG